MVIEGVLEEYSRFFLVEGFVFVKMMIMVSFKEVFLISVVIVGLFFWLSIF